MTDTDTRQAKEYYTKKFGYLITDYEGDRDVLQTLGSDKVRNMIANAFSKIQLENPNAYNYCVERFKQEHKRLYEKWE